MRIVRPIVAAACASVLLHSALSHAADDTDALSLESAPVAETPAAAGRPARLFVEGALGKVRQRHGLPSFTSRRLSLDYAQSFKLDGNWQVGISDRLDYVDPADTGADNTLNSLRELYAGWRDDSASTIVEFGRINVRHGPAYGYNPTDFFRTYAVRAATTVDPFALRENRMGTVMLRGQRLWAGGSASIAIAPRLDRDGPSNESFSLDLGATNQRTRLLATLAGRASDTFSGEVLLYAEEGGRAQVGLNATALLADFAVAHGEVTYGEDDDLLALALGAADPTARGSRAAVGVTFSIPTQLSLTAEYAYNGYATDIAGWAGPAPGRIPVAGRYLLEAQRRQDSAARRAWLIYATQKSLGLKNLDATALVRVNADDHSKLGWLELRYHWPGVDAALQMLWARGQPVSQYGLPPARQSVQLLAAWYF